MPTDVLVYVNGVVWVNRQKQFNEGTILPELEVAAGGYVITPSTIPAGEVVNEDKAYSFTAEATSETADLTIVITGLPDEYQVYVDDVIWVDNKKTFPINTSLVNIRPVIVGYSLVPTTVLSLTLDSDKTLTYAATLLPTGRRWSIDIGSQFTAAPEEDGITWNEFHPTNDEIQVPNGKTLSNMLTESGDASVVSLTNLTPLDGASNSYVTYSSTVPVWPITAVESGLGIGGDLVTFRFGGLDTEKTYDISLLSAFDTADSAIRFSNGAQSVDKVSTNNLPADGDGRYTSPALGILTDLVPDSSGQIDIDLEKIGGFYLTTINLILILEK